MQIYNGRNVLIKHPKKCSYQILKTLFLKDQSKAKLKMVVIKNINPIKILHTLGPDLFYETIDFF